MRVALVVSASVMRTAARTSHEMARVPSRCAKSLAMLRILFVSSRWQNCRLPTKQSSNARLQAHTHVGRAWQMSRAPHASSASMCMGRCAGVHKGTHAGALACTWGACVQRAPKSSSHSNAFAAGDTHQ
jgi:hypothetical protein